MPNTKSSNPNDNNDRGIYTTFFKRKLSEDSNEAPVVQGLYELETEVQPKPGIAVTQDEYTQTIVELYKNAQPNNLNLVPATLEDYIAKTKPDQNGKPTQAPVVQVFKEEGGKRKLIAEMSKDHCVLHQPLDAFVLKEIQQCYKSVEVSRCGSLEAALDIEEKMPGITFSESALKMIEDRFVKKVGINADRTQLDEFLSRARNQENVTEFNFKPKTPGNM